jgi:(R,R)-butanediol dehydrogenase/meso-butanediol dehydrogenase/diacetyl reductase
VEPLERRRRLARDLGADSAVAPEEAAALLGPGADVVYECAGVPATVQGAVDLVRRGGTVGLVGLAAGTATVSPGAWLVKEVTVVASLGYLHREFAPAMALVLDGRVALAPLVDAVVPLDRLPGTVEGLAADPSSAVKVLVDPTAG